MQDVIGNYGKENPANNTRVVRSGGVVDGHIGTGLLKVSYDQYPCLTVRSNNAAHPSLGGPSNAGAALQGSAMANPSNPSVGLLVSIGELRELPRMLLSQYRQNRRQSNSIAESEFGWAPMISDIRKLFEFPLHFQKRLQTIQALSKGPIRRVRTVYEAEEPLAVITSNFVEEITATTPLRVNILRESKKDVRVTTKWRPSQQVASLRSDSDMERLAFATVLGLNPEAIISSAWELLPWSWLIDWFANFGDILKLTNNSLALSTGLASVTSKQTTRIVTRYVSGASSTKSYIPAVVTRTTWVRAPSYPGLAFSLPLLGHKQTLILSSIAFNMGRR